MDLLIIKKKTVDGPTPTIGSFNSILVLGKLNFRK